MTDLNMYTAALYTNRVMPGQAHIAQMTEHEAAVCAAAPNILESYHYVNKDAFVNAMRANGAKVFLDSGAFSASTLGVKINIKDYCRYIQKNIDIIRVDGNALMASVLDEIGDEHGTFENQREMERLGVQPMPAFHAGEDIKYLDYYANTYEYINLGGLVGMSKAQLETWLDRMWEKHLTDGAGRPLCKVHGFAVTAEDLMRRYPWHSVDSSSWVQAAAFGSIMIPMRGPVKISSGSPAVHDWGQHYTNMTPIEQRRIEAYIRERGYDPGRLAEIPYSRFSFNIGSYPIINDDVNREKRERGLPPRTRELF